MLARDTCSVLFLKLVHNNNNNAFRLMYVRDKSCLSKAVCLAHLYAVYQSDGFDNHAKQHH